MPTLDAYTRRLQQSNPFPYYSTDLARQKSLMQLQAAVNPGPIYTPDPLPEYNYAAQALKLQSQTDKLLQQSAQNQIHNQTPIYKNRNINYPLNVGGSSPVAGGKGGTKLSALLRALGAQESGNRFGAVNSSSGALGQWQVMPSNVAGWSKQVLGHSISTSEFLHNPAEQKAIVSGIFGGYVKKYGIKGALSAWYSGNPNRYNDKSSVSGGPSVYSYVQSVLDRL